MTHLAAMTVFACLCLVSVIFGSTVQAHSSPATTLHNLPTPRVRAGLEWQISAARRAQHARASQKNAGRRQHGHFAQDNYQNPSSYKTLPDEVLQNSPVHFPVNHFQALEYEANNYRPASKYPQSIETYSHNYRREPAVYEDYRGQSHRPEHQFAQASNHYFDPRQAPHAAPYVQQEQNNHNNYIDYPPYPNHDVYSQQISQNPNPNTFPAYEAHKQRPYLESPPNSPQFPTNVHSPPYSGPFAPQFPLPADSIPRFPFVRDSYPPHSHAQLYRNPQMHSKPHNSYFYSSNGHHHHTHTPHSKHPPSYYDPDPELTAELQQLDKEYHAEKDGLSGGQSMYRLLVPLLMLGFSIPALGYMYTYMGRRRDFRSGPGSKSARLQYYSDLLARAVACYQQGDKCLEQKYDS